MNDTPQVPTPSGSDASAQDGPAPPGPARTGRSALLGAMFLMATSAIGPGFITQTTTFTAQLGAAFAFAVLISILVDIAVQLNVWRVIGVSRLRSAGCSPCWWWPAGWCSTSPTWAAPGSA